MYEGTFSQRGNEITSATTGKVYKFSRLDGSTAKGRDMALAQMRADDGQFVAAQTARNGGRMPTQRELIEARHGLRPKQPTGPQSLRPKPDDGTTNHALRTLAELQGLPEFTPQQRSYKRHAIAAMERLAAKNQAKIDHDARVKEMESDPEIQKALAHATEYADRLANSELYSQAEVDSARDLRDQLRADAINEEAHGTAAATYWDAASAHSRAIRERFKAKQKEQKALLADLNERVKGGEIELLPEVEPPPAAPEPTNAMQAAQQRAAELGVPVQ
jgi:hypothetical protein